MNLSQFGKNLLRKLGVLSEPLIQTQVEETSHQQSLRLDQQIKHIQCSADGTFIVCAVAHQIRIYNSSLSILIATLEGHTKQVNQIKIWQNSKIASGSDDTIVRVWDAQKLKQVVILQGHSTAIIRVEYLCFNKIIAIAKDQTVRIWITPQGYQLLQLLPLYLILDIQYLPHQQVLLQDLDDCLRVWDLRTKKQKSMIYCYNDWCRTGSVVTLKGKLIQGSGSLQKYIRFRDLLSGKIIRRLHQLHSKNTLHVHPGSNYVILSASNKSIYVWNLLTGMREGSTTDHYNDPSRTIAFSPDGHYIYSGNFNSILSKISVNSLLTQK